MIFPNACKFFFSFIVHFFVFCILDGFAQTLASKKIAFKNKLYKDVIKKLFECTDIKVLFKERLEHKLEINLESLFWDTVFQSQTYKLKYRFIPPELVEVYRS